MSRVEMTASTDDTMIFSVWVDGDRYDCPITREAVNLLACTQEPAISETDACLLMQEQVRALVEILVSASDVILPATLPTSSGTPALH